MAFIDLFPTVIFLKNLNNILDTDINCYKDIICNEILSQEGDNGSFTSNQKLLNNPSFINLKTQILYFSKKYLNELGHKFQDIQIASSWGNVLKESNQIHNHIHSNAYICGSFYLDDSSPIVFQNPLFDNWKFFPEFEDNSNNFRKFESFSIFPKSKDIIIFPSWLKHRVSPTSQNQRISIAFNIIPKGEFGGNTSKLYL